LIFVRLIGIEPWVNLQLIDKISLKFASRMRP